MQVKVILTDAENNLYDGVVQIGTRAEKSVNGKALFYYVEPGKHTLRALLVMGFRVPSQTVEINQDNQVITLLVKGE